MTHLTDAALMMELFTGSDLAHGRTEVLTEMSEKGKRGARSWTQKRPAVEADWQAHLDGTKGIGIMPINSENKVKWGAIDVDVYLDFSMSELNRKITESQLPLVLCRSKSGGPHIYLFVEEWVPARKMIEKLDLIAAFFGFGDSEIFPKQAAISRSGSQPDFGSWINMPYFGGDKTERYAIDPEDKAVPTVKAFFDYCMARRVSAEDFAQLRPPEPEELLPDGPPCLNHLFSRRNNANRNIILSNACVWAKKAMPENWETEIDRLNQLFPEPLNSAEVTALKKSYGKRDYRYQCNKSPLCNYCNSTLCRKKKYGVGGDEVMPSSRSLTKVDTNPPVWYLDLELDDGKTHRISLSTEQLQNPRLFQRRCMEAVHRMPPLMKEDQWQPIVEQLMSHVSIVEIPPEMTNEGQAIELIWEFLLNRSSKESMEDMLRGLPYHNAEGYHFRMRDLTEFLNGKRFNQLKNHELIEIIRTRMGGVNRRFRVIAGRGTNYVIIPNPKSKDNPTSLQPPEQDVHF